MPYIRHHAPAGPAPCVAADRGLHPAPPATPRTTSSKHENTGDQFLNKCILGNRKNNKIVASSPYWGHLTRRSYWRTAFTATYIQESLLVQARDNFKIYFVCQMAVVVIMGAPPYQQHFCGGLPFGTTTSYLTTRS